MATRAARLINTLYGQEIREPRLLRLVRWFMPHRNSQNEAINKRKRRIMALYRQRDQLITRGRVALFVGAVMFAGASSVSVVYFNRLTQGEQDIQMEIAKIDTLLQRRRNISINLARTVRDYAYHERRIFDHVSDTRAARARKQHDWDPAELPAEAPDPKGLSDMTFGNPYVKPSLEAEIPVAELKQTAASLPKEMPISKTNESGLSDMIAAGLAAGGDPVAGSTVKDVLSLFENGAADQATPFAAKMAGLLAVAENYPALKASENFKQFMEALIETEKDIATQRLAYSDVVNAYTTQLRTFPGRMFGFVFGFEMYPYFRVDDDARRFHPVEY